ncbi:hypothetical protein ERJ75_000047300 [Trypanosoma vivax]|nr:hypothetical protein ERJ75_000047700 [Trypanosoma vivax]KAH8620489.1 hypothetical protein ERJ75_000047300 [Trypanosoma vivax]
MCFATVAKNTRLDRQHSSSGPRHEVEERCRVATQNARQCGAALGESSWLAKKCGFICVPFNRDTGAVCASRKTIRKHRETPRMVYVAGVRGSSPFEPRFLPKAMGRGLSKLSGGLLRPNGGAGLPARAVARQALDCDIAGQQTRRTAKASAHIGRVSDRRLCERMWRACV